MSHWCKVASKMTDTASVEAALKRMGLEITGRNQEVSLYGKSEKADIVLGQEDTNAVLGLSRQQDGTFAVIGDFYHCRSGANSNKLRGYYGKDTVFQQELQTAYCIEHAKAKVEEAGFQIEQNLDGQIGDDGLITMVAVSYI